MKKFMNFFAEYPAISTISLLVIIPCVSQFIFDIHATGQEAGPVADFFLNSCVGLLASVVLFLVSWAGAAICSTLLTEFIGISKQYGINIFGLLNSKFIVDKHGATVWYDRAYNEPSSRGQAHKHRINGPAIEQTDGVIEWYLNDYQMEFHQFLNKSPISKKAKAKLKDKYVQELI
jgi:hypothetical protein